MIKLNEKLGIDERDRTILDRISSNPNISQAELGKLVKLSQPSVGARLQKLREKGILSVVSGMDFRKVELYLAKVEVSATDTQKVLDSFEKCPFFINGLVMSGTNNLCIFLTAPSIGEIEEVVNYHLRNHENVKDVRLDIVIKPVKDFVLPVSLDVSSCQNKQHFRERCRVCPVRTRVFEAGKKK